VMFFCSACSAGSNRFANGVAYAGLRTEVARFGVCAEAEFDCGLYGVRDVAALIVCARVLGTYGVLLLAGTSLRLFLVGVVVLLAFAESADFSGETKGLVRVLETLLSLRRFAVRGDAMLYLLRGLGELS
jgi:hypothetical protein